MTLGEFLLNEKTKVSLNIINFVILVGFAITASFTFATWKTQAEADIKANNTLIVAEIEERKESVLELNNEIDEIRPTLIETQTRLAEIKTDLEWIKSYLESRK